MHGFYVHLSLCGPLAGATGTISGFGEAREAKDAPDRIAFASALNCYAPQVMPEHFLRTILAMMSEFETGLKQLSL